MSLQLFTSAEFEIPVEFEQDGFLAYAVPVAQQLGYRDASDMVRFLPADCVVKRRPSENAGQAVGASARPSEKAGQSVPASTRALMRRGAQADWYLMESGFYRAIGQRQISRIPDLEVRARVERFQRWVFHEVLPAIRKRGQYSPEPFTTWDRDEVCAQIRQHYGFDFTTATLGRAFRDAGVLKQNGAPKARFRHLFHHTGTAWNLHPHALRQVVIAVLDARQAIEAAKAQMSLWGAES
ncbi:MAG: hypothetical protein K2Q25_02270 [Mycobacteriaceae bacterium]|nr:hypothetical protein [Mycobacteriaceae bacterium]